MSDLQGRLVLVFWKVSFPSIIILYHAFPWFAGASGTELFDLCLELLESPVTVGVARAAAVHFLVDVAVRATGVHVLELVDVLEPDHELVVLGHRGPEGPTLRRRLRVPRGVLHLDVTQDVGVGLEAKLAGGKGHEDSP